MWTLNEKENFILNAKFTKKHSRKVYCWTENGFLKWKTPNLLYKARKTIVLVLVRRLKYVDEKGNLNVKQEIDFFDENREKVVLVLVSSREKVLHIKAGRKLRGRSLKNWLTTTTTTITGTFLFTYCRGERPSTESLCLDSCTLRFRLFHDILNKKSLIPDCR